ncbi:MAG: alpha/beta hydrolase [Bacteroidales bacterium]
MKQVRVINIRIKQLFSFIFLFLPVVAAAQHVEVLKLWPDDPTASEAEIFVHHPARTDKAVPVVIVCPGGGYEIVSMEHEGHDMAKWFVSKGFVGIVLKYRMPNGIHSIPLSDAEKAVSIVRANAAKWGVDTTKIGVIGSSAGGHLAASLSNLAATENRPSFAILFYPVICFDNEATHRGSKANLLGKDINNKELTERYSLQKQVDGKTPETLIFVNDDDKTVVPQNSIQYYSALKVHDIPAAMYLFPKGGHGWGFRTTFPYHKEVKELITRWLEDMHITG